MCAVRMPVHDHVDILCDCRIHNGAQRADISAAVNRALIVYTERAAQDLTLEFLNHTVNGAAVPVLPLPVAPEKAHSLDLHRFLVR